MVKNRKNHRKQRMSIPEMAKTVGINRATYYRYMDWAEGHVNGTVRALYKKLNIDSDIILQGQLHKTQYFILHLCFSIKYITYYV